MKILIVSDIHLGDRADIGTKQYRTDYLSAKSKLVQSIPLWQQLKPDLVVQLGDLIMSSTNQDQDQRNFAQAIELVDQINSPVINLLGNHELRSFKKLIDKKYFGYSELENLQLIWLDFALDESGLPYLTDERLNWLGQLDLPKKPVIVLSHYPLTQFDTNGSFYFEKHPEAMQYQNHQQIRQAVAHLPVKLFISAHTHLVDYQHLDNQHFISNPAFSEDLTAQSSKQVNNPGIYSVLDLDQQEQRFVFSSYSGDWSFAKIEGEL